MEEWKDISAGSLWRHHSGRLYRVLFLTNVPEKHDAPDEDRRKKYPTTVVYENADSGRKFSRRADDWHRSMTKDAH